MLNPADVTDEQLLELAEEYGFEVIGRTVLWRIHAWIVSMRKTIASFIRALSASDI